EFRRVIFRSELESKRERDAEFTGEKYKSKFSGKYTPWIDEMTYRPKPDATDEEKAELNKKRDEALKPRPRTELKSSYFKNMAPASDMLLHVRNNVFTFIKDLNGELSPFTQYMKDASFIIQKPSLLVEAV